MVICSFIERMIILKHKMKFFLYISLAVLFFGCAASPRFTSRGDASVVSNSGKADTAAVYSNVENETILKTEIGVASYYAEPFHGRKTANGEIYDMNGLSAAHPTFPLGSVARVTNLKNGRAVILKINDRMPQRPDRIVDLSLGAAKELDMLKDGLAKVRIDILKWGDNKYISPK